MSLIGIMCKHMQPYVYKEALEWMYTAWEDFDEICNTPILPAFELDTTTEDNKDSNSNDNSSSDDNKDDKDDEKEKKEEEDKKKENGASGKAIAEQIKAMVEKLVEVVKRVQAWFREKMGKLDLADKEFKERLAKAKKNGLKNEKVEAKNYVYRFELITKDIEYIRSNLQETSDKVEAMYDKYLSDSEGKLTENDVNEGETSIFSEETGVSSGGWFAKAAKDMEIKEALSENTPTALMKAWENKIRGEKKDVTIDNAYARRCEDYLNAGFQETINKLKNDMQKAEGDAKSISGKTSSISSSFSTNQALNTKMRKYINDYSKFITFCTQFFQTAYSLTIEIRNNCKIVLQKAYDF